jgi:ribose 5-phosphate isomerase B
MPGKRVISERHVLDADARGERTLVVPKNALITALARDTARDKGISFASEINAPPTEGCGCPNEPGAATVSVVAIGSDHGGFDLKADVTKHLREKGIDVIDVGTHSSASCDYPDFAYAVSRIVIEGRAPLGIMIDGAGIGSAMVCNKVPGIRAACAYNEFTAWNSRAHNNANLLTLGSRTLGIEVCKRIVDVFLATEFEGGRHEGRVGKMADIEARFAK